MHAEVGATPTTRSESGGGGSLPRRLDSLKPRRPPMQILGLLAIGLTAAVLLAIGTFSGE